MFRMPLLVDALDLPYLLDVADAMEDGSYYAERSDGDARDCGQRGLSGD